MKISILEMCQIFLYKIRKLEQDIRDVLKINQKEVLFKDIEFIIEEKKMEERRKRNSMRSQMPNHPDPKKTKRKLRKRSTVRNNNRSRKQIKNQNQAQGNQQGPTQERIPQERFNHEDVNIVTTKTSTINDRDRNLQEDPKIKTKDELNPRFQPEIPKEKRKEEEKKNLNKNQEIADDLREKARKLMEEKNFEDARIFCSQAEKYAPKDARILANMCLCFWQQKDFGNCFEVSKKKIIFEEDLDFREEKLLKNMFTKFINSALILEKFQIAFRVAKKAINQFKDPEIEKLFQKCENLRKFKKEKSFSNP